MGVNGDGFLEAVRCLFVIESVRPDKTSIKPDLSILAACAYTPMK
jgi:hypothetical protein